MSDNKQENYNNGVNFFSLLQLMFIYLKLTAQITWSWWWVLSPFGITTGIVILIVLAALAIKLLS